MNDDKQGEMENKIMSIKNDVEFDEWFETYEKSESFKIPFDRDAHICFASYRFGKTKERERSAKLLEKLKYVMKGFENNWCIQWDEIEQAIEDYENG